MQRNLRLELGFTVQAVSVIIIWGTNEWKGNIQVFHFPCAFPIANLSPLCSSLLEAAPCATWWEAKHWAAGWWQPALSATVLGHNPPKAQADICRRMKNICSILWSLCPSCYPLAASQLQNLQARSVRELLIARRKLLSPGLKRWQLNVIKSKGSHAGIL